MKKLLILLACAVTSVAYTNGSAESLANEQETNMKMSEPQEEGLKGHKFEANGIYYEITAYESKYKTVKVTFKGASWDEYLNEYSGEVVIPSEVMYNNTAYTVDEIGYNAFCGCDTMTSIVIPESIIIIESGAFRGCEALKQIHINNLSAWCNLSFTSLTDFVGASPFYYAEELYLNGELVTDLVIPTDVTEIGFHTFENYTKLRSLHCHKNVKGIGKSAFYGCSNLETISIPTTIDYICPNAFRDTKWYENQPDGVVYIGKHLYKYKGDMPENTTIVVKEGTTVICEDAFFGCKGLARLELPRSLQYIGKYAFDCCPNLKEIYLKATTPPEANRFYHDCTNDDTTILYIPKGRKKAYTDEYFLYFRPDNVVEVKF